MGLDSFWLEPKPNADGQHDVMNLEVEDDFHLCGGMMSGSGSGSFRGKMYEDVVRGITGISLYEEMTDNATVCKMAADLEAANYDAFYGLDKPQMSNPLDDIKDVYAGAHRVSREEFVDLQRMFRLYADAGANLHGWW
jgi:hypothetical protein